MNSINNSTKIEMLCELAHNRVMQDNDTNLILDEDGDYTTIGQGLFDEWYDYYDSIISTYLKEKKQ